MDWHHHPVLHVPFWSCHLLVCIDIEQIQLLVLLFSTTSITSLSSFLIVNETCIGYSFDQAMYTYKYIFISIPPVVICPVGFYQNKNLNNNNNNKNKKVFWHAPLFSFISYISTSTSYFSLSFTSSLSWCCLSLYCVCVCVCVARVYT